MTYYVEIQDDKICQWTNDVNIANKDFKIFVETQTEPNYQTHKYNSDTGTIEDISQEPEYIARQKAKEKESKKAEILKEIDGLEKTQLRAVREIALNKDAEFAMDKLQALDKQISELRTQMAWL